MSTAVRVLREAGIDQAELDTRLLAAHALGLDRTQLLTDYKRELTEQERGMVADVIERRMKHEPVSRIMGNREFWGLTFALNAATLDPRADSETLIEAALDLYPERKQPLQFLDLGTGTGCLLIALLTEYPHAKGIGTDISDAAVKQATANAAANSVGDRAAFKCTDWNSTSPLAGEVVLPGEPSVSAGSHSKTGVGVSPLQKPPPLTPPARGGELFDLVISNPPYIRAGEIAGLMPEVRNFDPRAALDGGDDGLAAYRTIAALLPTSLKPTGAAVLEVGHDQAAQVADVMKNAGLKVKGTRRDLGGVERCVIAQLA